MSLAAWMLVAAGLAAQAPQTEGDKDDKKYTLDFSKTTQQVQPGSPGMFWMQIQAAPGFKVSQEAPLKIALQGEGVKLDKSNLGVSDSKDKKADSPEFGVKFATEGAGDKAITVDATFFVCDDKICERKKEKVTVPVSVRP